MSGASSDQIHKSTLSVYLVSIYICFGSCSIEVVLSMTKETDEFNRFLCFSGVFVCCVFVEPYGTV